MERRRHDAVGVATGMLASGGVVIDPSGNLYGSATGGTAGRMGLFLKLASGSGTITTFASFNGTNEQPRPSDDCRLIYIWRRLMICSELQRAAAHLGWAQFGG